VQAYPVKINNDMMISVGDRLKGIIDEYLDKDIMLK